MSEHDQAFYRVAGILIAHDPLKLAMFGKPGEYDTFVGAIMASPSRESLEGNLHATGLFTDGLFRSLKRFLGMDETVEELYPIPPRPQAVTS